MTASFNVSSKSLFVYRLIIRHCIDWDIGGIVKQTITNGEHGTVAHDRSLAFPCDVFGSPFPVVIPSMSRTTAVFLVIRSPFQAAVPRGLVPFIYSVKNAA